MRKSTFVKIFSGYVLIVLIFSSLVIMLSSGIIREFYLHALISSLKNFGLAVETMLTPYVKEGRYEELNTIIKDLGRRTQTRITLIDPAGTVIIDSERDPALMENHRNRPEIQEALTGRIGSSSRYSTTVKEPMVYAAIPLKQEEAIIGIARLSRFTDDIYPLLADVQRNVWKMAGVALVLSLALALVFSRSLTKPIRDLQEAVQRVASGDFDVKVFIKDHDDAIELADNFNAMTDQIKSLFNELSRQKDSLNNIIASVQEGLAVLDSSGKIVRSNESFQRVARNPRVEGKFYWEVIREARFSELVREVITEKRSMSREIELGNRIFLSSAALLEGRGEAVIMLHDITELKNVEKVKKDFVVNVSHELRTPLTAIKGFAETLEDEVGEGSKQYVDVIKRNADRLMYIVQDLLTLSELEEKGYQLTVEDVDLREVIDHVIRIFNDKMQEKHLDLTTRIDAQLPTIKADSFRLEQLFINLLDNAVKYTEKGAIILALQRRDDRVEVTVEDTGIGIPSEHLPRIFERFYVVDKSRSKKAGGTGLGLSIVKHIVLLHWGTIRVESIFGMGTKFIVSLPIDITPQ